MWWKITILCLCNILCTINMQHTSRQDAIIAISLYLATCFGHNQPSSGQLRTISRYSKNSAQWDPISFTLKLEKVSFRFLWPCIVSKLWSERENQQDATVRCLFLTISQHVSGTIMPILRRTRHMFLRMGVMVPETCWEIVKNKHLTVASCWFSLSLHNLKK